MSQTPSQPMPPSEATQPSPSPNAPSSHTTAAPSPQRTPEPPPLPYSIKNHKIPVLIVWTLLALDAFVLPIVLFYPLWYATKLRTGRQAIIFAITTSVFGIISGLEWGFRSWQLMTKPHVRPLRVEGPAEVGNTWQDVRRGFWSKKRYYWGFDFFHFSYSTGYMIALAELIVGAAPHQPFIRLCAAPSPSFITIFGLLILTITTYHHLGLRAPFRISSEPKGSLVRPATYTILEDVLSVDTGLGRTYRAAVTARYDQSPHFRRLLRQMDLFWGIPALLLGVGLLATIGHEKVEQTKAYGLGWAMPPVWAMIWAAITTVWVKISLRREKKAWRLDYERKEDKEMGISLDGENKDRG